MTEPVKGRVAHVSHAGPKTKAEKVTEKATKATEKMHNDVTASLDQLQHHDVKTGVPKDVAGAKKAPHKGGSPTKKI